MTFRLETRKFTISVLLLSIVILNSVTMIKKGFHNVLFVSLLRDLLLPVPVVFNPALDGICKNPTPYFLSGQRFEAYCVRLNGLDRLLDSYPYKQLNEGRSALNNAQTSLAHGDMVRGKELLHLAMNTGVEIIQLEAHLLLAQVLNSQGDSDGYNRYLEGASLFAQPEIAQTDTCPDWQLHGVFIDERELISDLPVHIILIWQRPHIESDDRIFEPPTQTTEADSTWSIRIWRDYVFQMGTAKNLIRDGGFERTGLPRVGMTSQLPFRLYGYELRSTELAFEIPELSQNMTLFLDGHGNEAVGVSTHPIGLFTNGSDISFLIVGRYRSGETADPLIGIRWLLKGVEAFGDNLSTYVVRTPSLQWVYFAGLYVPHVESESLQYWVVNTDHSSVLQVDNIGLWRVPLACAQDQK